MEAPGKGPEALEEQSLPQVAEVEKGFPSELPADAWEGGGQTMSNHIPALLLQKGRGAVQRNAPQEIDEERQSSQSTVTVGSVAPCHYPQPPPRMTSIS